MHPLHYLVPILLIASACMSGHYDFSAFNELEPCEDYFPLGTFPQEYEGTEDILREWYATPLKAIQAPCLRQFEIPDISVVRFTWIPSFDPSIVVTVLVDDDSCLAQAVSVEWEMDTFMPFTAKNINVGEMIQATLSKDDCRRLQSAIDISGFWQMPSADPNDTGHDGAQWILEVGAMNKYHVTDRWDPTDDYREAFRLAINSVGLYSDQFEKY